VNETYESAALIVPMGMADEGHDYAAAIGKTIDRAGADASVPTAQSCYCLNVRDG